MTRGTPTFESVAHAEELWAAYSERFKRNYLKHKHKPMFTPHLDTGDHVIIVNADKVVLTAGKADKKMVYRHSGYPGGIKAETYGNLLERKPADAIRKTIKGMLPSNRLGNQMLTKLKVYAGPDHPHAAQQPQPLVLDQARADR